MEVAKFPIVLLSEEGKGFDPCLNLKVVLVEEGGQLKIGYFEFLPPSMLD